MLFNNGLILGAMSALYTSRGLGADFWAWVLPHGVTELGAICLCGMGGLALGMAVVFPGDEPRLEHLANRGRELGALAVGCLALFLIAAFIEGFFRQLVTDITVRWTVAGLTTIFWVAYFVFAGRRRRGR